MVYLANNPYRSSDIYHHGIKGQRWGVRRFQNPDGTLTEEGKRRYGTRLEGSVNPNNKGAIRRLVTGDIPIGFLGKKRIADRLENLETKVLKDNSNKKGTAAYESLSKMQKAQKQLNTDRDVYLAKTSTGKLFVQNMLLPAGGDHLYRNLRSMDVSRGRAAAETALSYFVPFGKTAINIYETNRKYGGIAY